MIELPDDFSGVVLVGDEVEARGLANRADDIPNTRETRFGAASCAKTLTATTVARLVDAGELRFETRVADVLPEELRPRDLAAAVTVHHLLSHTSGIGDYYDEATLGPGQYDAVWTERPTYAFRRPADFVPLFRDLPRRGEPGGAFAYNNAAYILLALIVEHVTELSFPEAVAREVLAPAGMRDSGYFALDDPQPRTATGYLADGRTNVFSIPAVGGGDGGVFLTVDDVVRFFAAFESGALVREETRRRMVTPHTPRYGYGFWLLAGGHGLAGEDPGASARALRLSEEDLTLVVLSNVTAGAEETWRRLRAWLTSR